MTRPTVLFFARGDQVDFFPLLTSDRYDSIFVTMTRAERALVESMGQTVSACFEEEYDGIEPAPVPQNYLLTSLVADRFLGRFGYEKRIEILGKEIAFWRTLLDRYRPVAVSNELIAIEISEVLMLECRERDIRYLAPMHAVFSDRFYWLPDPLSLSGELLPEVAAGPEAAAAARAYITAAMTKDYKPFYVKNLRGRRALRPLAIAFLKIGLWKYRKWLSGSGRRFIYEMYDDEYAKRIEIYLKGFFLKYDALEDIPADAEVIFYPLHQEPEATVSYNSEFYSNQAGTIENILKCLAPGQVLVVKEHPVDKGVLLQSRFWDVRRRHSALYYLPAEVPGRNVLARSRRVVTLTSTVGWEAALLGQRVYVLGKIFYDRLAGIDAIPNFPALRAALRRPADEGERLTVAAAEAFIARLAELSYPGNPFPHAGRSDRANAERIAFAIAEAAGL